jgi:predicted phosphate transport protein (TIGR00153 family)
VITPARRTLVSLIKDLFRESPFEPLRYHMKAVSECVALVRPMFNAVRDGQYEKLQEVAKKIFKAEHQADIIKDDIRRTIPKRFFLPVYRGDLLGYVKLQDDMADAVEDLAVLLTIKNLVLPRPLVEPTFEYLSKVEDVCHRTCAIGDYLPTLVEGDMAGDEAERTLAMIADVEKAEWEADRLQYTLSQKLFALEDEMKATDILLWFRVFGELGQLANFAEKTGDRLRRMLSS